MVALLTACGAGPGRAQPDPKQTQEALLRQMREIDQRLGAVEGRLGQHEDRIDKAEQRLGLRPLRPESLTAARGLRLELPKARFVAEAGARPKTRSLDQHLAGRRGAVFAFWATWCKPCIADEELVLLRTLQRRLGPDTPLISMACDELEKVRGHTKAGRWIYPLWQMNDGHLAMLPQRFIQENGLGLPLFVITDAEGNARWFRNAKLDAAVVEEILTAARL